MPLVESEKSENVSVIVLRPEIGGPADEVFFAVAMDRLAEQNRRADALNTKAISVSVAASSGLTVFGGLLALGDVDLSGATTLLVVAGFAVYLLLLYSAYVASRMDAWSLRPDLQTLQAYCETYGNAEMRIWVARECVVSIDTNEPRLHRKSIYLARSLAALAVEAGLLSAAAIVTLL